jgi:hypothetical protein
MRRTETRTEPDPPDAKDPGRYHPTSAIRRYLVAEGQGAATQGLLAPAVHERWTVKTGADADAQALTNQVPTPGTISALTALPVPSVLPPNGRSDGAEKTVWSVRATLTAYAAEADGDYHMVIADQDGRTMIAEIPKPGDIPGRSYFAAEIANARNAFDDHFRITESPNQPTPAGTGSSPFRDVRIGVTLLGLGFFDFDHNQRGVAPNAIELHPVVNIVFDPSR